MSFSLSLSHSFLSIGTLELPYLRFFSGVSLYRISEYAAPPSSSGSRIYASTLSTAGFTGPQCTSACTSPTTNGSFQHLLHHTPSTHSMVTSNPYLTIYSSTFSHCTNIPIWDYSALSIYGLSSSMIAI